MTVRTEERAMLKAWEEMADDYERCLAVAEHVMGWTWWAFTKEERDVYHEPPTPRVVRTLRRPGFPNKRERKSWEEWARESGNVFRPADGTEPIERIQGTGDAMRSCMSRMPNYLGDSLAAMEVLSKVEKWRKVRRQKFVEIFYTLLGTEDILKAFWAFRDNPSVVSRAAYSVVREEAGE